MALAALGALAPRPAAGVREDQVDGTSATSEGMMDSVKRAVHPYYKR